MLRSKCQWSVWAATISGGRLDADQSAEVVSAALDAGITFFDTADTYGGTQSEEILGNALGKRRNEVVVATKFGMAVDSERKGAKPEYLSHALEDSLRRLRTDHIDLYQLHQPDPDTPIADTLAALEDHVRAGKVREIGCSNFSAEQIREAHAAARQGAARFVSVQNEYSLLNREPEQQVLPECERSGMAFIPFFPLAGGILTGKYRRGEFPPPGSRLTGEYWAQRVDRLLSEERLSVVESLEEMATRRGCSLLEVAFGWLVAQPRVASVIAGATSPEQVRENVKAASWSVSDEQVAEANRLTGNLRQSVNSILTS